MKERPILFSGPMVRALLAGAKTQTRRAVNPQPTHFNPAGVPRRAQPEGASTHLTCRYGERGDRLWVRESFAHIYCDNAIPEKRRDDDVAFMADGFSVDRYVYGSWKPSIHMPRWASRILLEITEVRVERLQDISRGDAMDEGCPFPNMAQGDDPRKWYAELWDQISGPGAWAANPWVWAVSFKVLP